MKVLAIHSVCAFVFLCQALSAQVHVDAPIRIEGDEGQRQLTGLPSTVQPTSVLTAGMEVSGAHRYTEALGGTIWAVSLTALDTLPKPGTQLNVRVPATLTGPVSIALNGGPPTAVVWGPDDPVMQEDLSEGEILSLVHDGTVLHALNGRDHTIRDCPSGMVAVNSQYCVEIAQRGAQVMQDAILTCAAMDRRLCSWGEFQAACERREELGILAPGNDWEWTNNSANSSQNARVVRYKTTSSFTACVDVGTRNMTGPAAPYRCCRTR